MHAGWKILVFEPRTASSFGTSPRPFDVGAVRANHRRRRMDVHQSYISSQSDGGAAKPISAPAPPPLSRSGGAVHSGAKQRPGALATGTGTTTTVPADNNEALPLQSARSIQKAFGNAPPRGPRLQRPACACACVCASRVVPYETKPPQATKALQCCPRCGVGRVVALCTGRPARTRAQSRELSNPLLDGAGADGAPRHAHLMQAAGPSFRTRHPGPDAARGRTDGRRRGGSK